MVGLIVTERWKLMKHVALYVDFLHFYTKVRPKCSVMLALYTYLIGFKHEKRVKK